MSGFRRAPRSASRPKTMAPTGRMARVAVMVHTMALLVTWNWAARVSTRNTSTKKSKASRVQPRKLAVTACHCPGLAGDGKASEDVFEGGSIPSLFNLAVTGECTTRMALEQPTYDDSIALPPGLAVTGFLGDHSRHLKPGKGLPV